MRISKDYPEVEKALTENGWHRSHQSTETVMEYEFHVDLWHRKDRSISIRHNPDGISGVYEQASIAQRDHNRSPVLDEIIDAIK